MGDFKMGATLVLKDMASATFGTVRKASDLFKASVTSASTATSNFSSASMRATSTTKTYTDSMGRLRDENGRFVTGAQRSEASVKSLGNAMSSAKEKALGLKQGLQAFLALESIKKGYEWLIGGNASMEQYKNTLTVVLGDATKATNTLAWAQKFAAQTPFEIPEIVEATTRLSAYGMEAKKVLGVTGDMASVMGKPLMQAVEAVADAQTGELERLKEFGITKAMLQKQAQSMGSNPINNKGQITDQAAFNAALFALMEKRFKGGMEMQSQTFKGMLSNAADFMGTMGRKLGEPLFNAAKAGLGDFLGLLNRLQENGAIDRFIADVQHMFNPMNYAFGSIMKYLSEMSGFFKLTFNNLVAENKPKIDNIVTTFKLGFGSLKPVMENAFHILAYEIIPRVVVVLGDIITKATDIVNFFANNWSSIKPYIEGVAIAAGVYFGVIKSVELAVKAWTAAQIILDAVLTMNPIGLVIVAIGLLIGAGIALYQNWDTVKAKAEQMWVNMKNYFIDGANSCIDAINKLIGVINMIPGVDPIPKIGNIERAATKEEQVRLEYAKMRKADGSHANGLSYVPFDGYRAILHKGEMVLTAREAANYGKDSDAQPLAISRADVDPAGNVSNKTSKVVRIEKLIEKLEIHGTENMDEEKLVDVLIAKLYEKLSAAGDIAGTADMEVLL